MRFSSRKYPDTRGRVCAERVEGWVVGFSNLAIFRTLTVESVERYSSVLAARSRHRAEGQTHTEREGETRSGLTEHGAPLQGKIKKKPHHSSHVSVISSLNGRHEYSERLNCSRDAPGVKGVKGTKPGFLSPQRASDEEKG